MLFLNLNNQKYVDVLYVLLVRSERFSLLPELYEVFGRETLLKFLEVFEGTTFKVPSSKDINKVARDTAIYVRLTAVSDKARSVLAAELAHEYEIPTSEVLDIYDEVKDQLAVYDFKAIAEELLDEPK